MVPGGADAKPWSRRYDLRVEDDRAPLAELARLLRVARAYDAFDRASDLATAGDAEGALASSEAAVALAPEDDQILLWHALFLAANGRIDDARGAFQRATAAEPRGGEHLRRFAAAGHVPPETAPLIERLIG